MSVQSIYNEKVKSNFSSEAKGLEKIIMKSVLGVIDATDGMNKTFYGKPIQSGSYVAGTNRLKNPLDLGIIPILDKIVSVDFCNVINYAISKSTNSGKQFDVKKQPEDFFGKIKWRFQKTAYDVQLEIDRFYKTYPNIDSEASRKEAFSVVNKITNHFSAWTKGIRDVTNESKKVESDQDVVQLTNTFPQLKNIGNYVSDKLEYFKKFDDYRQIPNEDYQKLLIVFNKIRQYCVIIQSLNTPAALVSSLQIVGLGDEVDKAIKSIQDVIDPTKAIPTLKKIVEVCKTIRNICNTVRSLINTGQLIVKVALILIKVFKVIIKFLKALPVPNLFTTVGITTTFAEVVKVLESKGVVTFQTRLKQLTLLFNFIIIFLDTVIPILGDIILKLNALILSLQNCKNVPEDLLKDLIEVRDGLELDYKDFNKFLDNKKQKDKTKNSNNTFGDYTIQIITEEVTEEAISLKRRYGVALNKRGLVTVQSSPTFASDDQIIIQEVKLLLQTTGAVDSVSINYSPEELSLLNEASSYLYEDDINWENFEDVSFELDEPNNMNEDQDDLGLNAFINKLKGSKKLRRKMRKIIKKNNDKLSLDMKNIDPSNKYSKQFSSVTNFGTKL